MIFQVGECYIKDERIYRILLIEDQHAITVTDVEDIQSWEVCIPYDDFLNDIQCQHIRFIAEPYQSLFVSDDQFTAKQIERRNQRLSSIQPLIYDEHGHFRPEILDPQQRGCLVREHAQKTGVSKDTLNDCLRLFLKRGRVKNSLIPLGFEKIGNQGRRKNHQQTTGRPTRLARHEGRQDKRPNLTDKDIERLRQGYKKYYVDNPRSSLETAHERTLDEYFSEVEIINGERHVKLYPPERLPTIGQFIYWCHQSRNLHKHSREARNKKNRRTAKGDGPPNLTERGYGPGSEIMADWTHGHPLRSSHNPSIDIGRAIIFFLICVYTRMVVGFHVSFQENWESIMIGVESMAMNKSTFCAQFGKTVPEELWPCAFIPDRMFYDGGKLDQHNTSGIVAMGVDAQTGGPYAPERRAIVEVLNRKIKQKLKEYLGNTHKKDFDDDAAIAWVDRRTYIRIIIEVIIEYNQEPIKDYPLTQDMRQKGVPPVPIMLWEYGVMNRCRPRQFDLEVVRFNLLPSGKAKVYRTHIEFQDLTYEYTGSSEEQEYFYGQALLKKQGYYWIDVKYHPGLVDYIYLYEGRNLVGVCELSGNDQQFLGCSWREVKKQQEQDQIVIEQYKQKRNVLQQHANSRSRIDADVEQAKKERREAQQRKDRKSTYATGREQRNEEAQRLSKDSASRPEDIGATLPKKKRSLEQVPGTDPDVTMLPPQSEAESHESRLSPHLEKIIRANRPRRRK